MTGLAIEHRALRIAGQAAPVRDGRLERGAAWGVTTRGDVVEGDFVRRDESDLGADLDREIADGHALFDAEPFDQRACELDRAARAGIGAQSADRVQDQIFR